MPLNIDWQQILLHLFNFVILFAVLYFLLYKPVKQFMEKRTAYYQQMEDQAREKLDQAEAQKAVYAAQLQTVDQQIAQKRDQAEQQAAQALAENRQQAEKQAQQILAQAQAQAEKQREKILNDAQNEIRAMVASAAEQLLAPADTNQAYDQFLNAAQRSGHDE